MLTNKKNKKGLGNPAAAALVASSPAAAKAVDKATEVVPFVLKTAFVGILIYTLYRVVVPKFKKMEEIPAYGAANVTYAQAAAKAQSLYDAMYGFGNGFENVKEALRVGNGGLNYNGYVRVYNAFGQREPFSHIPVLNPRKMTLTEWINDQFNDEEKAELRFIVNGFF